MRWAKKVSKEFADKVIRISSRIETEPDFMMTCMAFESGETFSPSIKNAAGSGATGLIQFMPSTAAALGTTTQALSRMTDLDQLDYVEKYFKAATGRLKTLEDVYMWILWPAAVGKPLSYVLFNKNDANHPKRYIQNAGLDFNKDGLITKEEVSRKIRQKYEKGLLYA